MKRLQDLRSSDAELLLTWYACKYPACRRFTSRVHAAGRPVIEYISSLNATDPDKALFDTVANISFSPTNVVSGRTLSYITEYSEHMQSSVCSSFGRVDGSTARIVTFLEHVCLKNKHHIAVVQGLGTLSSDEESG